MILNCNRLVKGISAGDRKFKSPGAGATRSKLRISSSEYGGAAPEGLQDSEAQGFNPGKHSIKRFVPKGRKICLDQIPQISLVKTDPVFV